MDDRYTISTSREIDAPIERVWNAWTDPQKIARWWGPAGFRSTVIGLDVRVGGRFDVIMHGPDGTDYVNTYIFDRVERPGLLVYTNQGSKDFGLAPFQSVVNMEPVGDRTRVVMTARYASAEEERKHLEDFHAKEGSEQLLERLEEQAKGID